MSLITAVGITTQQLVVRHVYKNDEARTEQSQEPEWDEMRNSIYGAQRSSNKTKTHLVVGHPHGITLPIPVIANQIPQLGSSVRDNCHVPAGVSGSLSSLNPGRKGCVLASGGAAISQ